MAVHSLEIDLEYLPTIEGPPASPRELYRQACANDDTTVISWKDTWINHYRTNRERYGPFKDHSAAQFHNLHRMKPCIISGSGPSLKRNAHLLKDRKDIPLVSCLHNYSFFESQGIKPDFYLTLDSGDIVLNDIMEGGNGATPDQVWESTKDHKLLAYCASPPQLLERWQGEVYFYNSVIPSEEIVKAQESIEVFRLYFATGGNALGAVLYFAKAVLGCNPIVFTGADFAFGYTKQFHAWPSATYDKPGQYVRAMNCYGMSVKTWQSYYNFKCYFDWLCCTVPGLYINATEGGCLGSYNEGNIKQIMQMPLEKVLQMYNLSNEAPVPSADGTTKLINVKEIFDNPEHEMRFCMY